MVFEINTSRDHEKTENDVFVDSVSLEDVQRNELNYNRAHSVQSVHTEDLETATLRSTPISDIDELEQRLQRSNQHIKQIQNQREQLLRLTDSFKLRLNMIEKSGEHQHETQNMNLPKFATVEAMNSRIFSLSERLHELNNFINMQHDVESELNSDVFSINNDIPERYNNICLSEKEKQKIELQKKYELLSVLEAIEKKNETHSSIKSNTQAPVNTFEKHAHPNNFEKMQQNLICEKNNHENKSTTSASKNDEMSQFSKIFNAPPNQKNTISDESEHQKKSHLNIHNIPSSSVPPTETKQYVSSKENSNVTSATDSHAVQVQFLKQSLLEKNDKLEKLSKKFDALKETATLAGNQYKNESCPSKNYIPIQLGTDKQTFSGLEKKGRTIEITRETPERGPKHAGMDIEMK